MNIPNHPLIEKWKTLLNKNNTHLCIGLDPDISKLPAGYEKSPSGIEIFLCDIIDLTYNKCIAYKPNISFFEAYGVEGLVVLKNVISYVNKRVPVILDAKRGDIGNTSSMQAKFIFEYFNADATTLHPYMGLDSLEPFFNYKDKFNFVLGLTSNPGSQDFEQQAMSNGKSLSDFVITTLSEWNKKYKNIGVVVGATENKLAQVRSIDENLTFLIPGVGSQGGSYETAVKNGKNTSNLALINCSRSILYCAKTKHDMEANIDSAIKKITNNL